MSIYEIILNMIIVSIPEEFLITVISLIIMGRYDYLDKFNIKSNFKKVFFIVVVPSVLLFSFTLYGLHLNLYIKFIVNAIGVSAFMIILLREKRLFKVLFSSTLSLAISAFLEIFTLLFLMYIFSFDISVINTSPYVNFILLIPRNIIQIAIIYIVYIKKNSIANINIIDMWHNNRIFRRFIYVYIIINTFILFHFYNKFAIEKCINHLSYKLQMMIISTLFILFIIEMVFPWIAIYTIYPSEKLRNKLD